MKTASLLRRNLPPAFGWVLFCGVISGGLLLYGLLTKFSVPIIAGLAFPFVVAVLYGSACFFASGIRIRYKLGIPIALVGIPACLTLGSYWQARRVADDCAEGRGFNPPPWHTEFRFWWTEYPTMYPKWSFWYDGVGVDIPALFPLKKTAETYAVMIHWG